MYVETLTAKKYKIFKQKHGPSNPKKVYFNLIIISFWLFKDCGAKLITVFLPNHSYFVYMQLFDYWNFFIYLVKEVFNAFLHFFVVSFSFFQNKKRNDKF